jgi:hypothetical protein
MFRFLILINRKKLGILLKLQKRFNRRVGDKEYSKWIVILPDALVAKLNWKEGVQLESNINLKNGSLILKPVKDN